MVQYANSFTCSSNDNGNEIIIQFRQLSPKLDDEGVVTGTNAEMIAGIMVTKQGASALLELLKSIVEQSEQGL